MKAEARVLRSALMFERLRRKALDKGTDTKGYLGQSLGENPDIPSIGRRVAIGRGVIVDDLGKMRCPAGTPNANQFTDIRMSNCMIASAETAVNEVADVARTVIDSVTRAATSNSSSSSLGIEQLAEDGVDVLDEVPLDKGLNNPARFDPNAVDADNDGKVQEGTPFERIATPSTSVFSRAVRKIRGAEKDKRITTDTNNSSFKQARQRAVSHAQARARDLSKPARKMFSGRQRPASHRRKLLDGSSFAQFPGIQRLFKSRDDAYTDMRESTIKTLASMQDAARNGTLNFHVGSSRESNEQLKKYLLSSTPEKMFEDLERSAMRLHDSIEKMPVQVRTQADTAEMILIQGLLGDPRNRIARPDMKTPWVISQLAESGHVLSDEDMRMLEMNGLHVSSQARGSTYETLREILEQAMGFNGAKDRNGRPVYGYFVTPSPRTTELDDTLTEVGKRLLDESNSPNLIHYSSSSLVRMRDSVKDRTGYSFGDSLRNGILPRRLGTGDDKDTSLAVIHDRDFTNFKRDSVNQEFREIQQRYLMSLMRWNLSGDSSHLTRHDYIEAVVPFDVSPDEIDEMVIATDKLSVFRKDFDDVIALLHSRAAGANMGANSYGALISFLQDQASQWDGIVKAGGGKSEVAQFASIDSLLKEILQLSKGNHLRQLGEKRGITMTVGPTRASSHQTLDDAIFSLIQRFSS